MVAVSRNLSGDGLVVLQAVQGCYSIFLPLSDKSHRSNIGF